MTIEQIHIAELRESRNRLQEEQRGHRANCPVCDAASRSRRLSGECATGSQLRARLRNAQSDLRAARDEQRSPFPGQMPLFTESEVRAASKPNRARKKDRTP